MKLSVALLLAVPLLAACEPKPQTSNTPEARPTTVSPQTAPPVAGNTTLQPHYAGTYAVVDTVARCNLSITVTKQAAGYAYSYGTTQGAVDVTREGADTYFTFVGLKGEDPEEDVTAAWQDSMLLIQNYGNSMNEYTRFGGCDAKYLELLRQR